jgi:hypothetical protein
MRLLPDIDYVHACLCQPRNGTLVTQGLCRQFFNNAAQLNKRQFGIRKGGGK